MEMIEKEMLVSQEDALKQYLDSLLCGGEIEPAKDNVTESVLMRRQISNLLFDEVCSEATAAEERIKPPSWATDFFSCLPILVGSVTLLIPLKQIRTVMPIRQSIIPLEGAPRWVSGTIDSFSQQMTIVDLEKMVDLGQAAELEQTVEPEKTLNETKASADNDDNENALSQLVLTHTGSLGLGCHEVDKVQQLNPEDVIWRAKHSTRRWAVGVSMKHQLVIVDTRRIAFALSMLSC